MAYAGGWKKLEPMWDLLIRAKRATSMLPVLEGVLSGFGQYRPGELTRRSEREMDRKNRAPLKLVLPVETGDVPPPPAPPPCDAGRPKGMSAQPIFAPRSGGPAVREGEASTVELGQVHSAPDAPRPTFVPLALAIDMGQTGPIGSLTTTTIDVTPAPSRPQPSWKPRPLAPARPAPSGRRHLRLLPDPGS